MSSLELATGHVASRQDGPHTARPGRRGALLAVAGFLVSTIGLTGCGVEPLYARKPADPGPVPHLAAIQISPIADRAGQLLRNALIDRLTPRSGTTSSLYRLDVSLDEQQTNLVILRDSTSTFSKARFLARYALVDIGTGRRLTQGRAESTTTFDIVESEFANLSAEADARRRAASEVAEDIRLRLALFFQRATQNRR
jgi:LPS-assembly lipoprotein